MRISDMEQEQFFSVLKAKLLETEKPSVWFGELRENDDLDKWFPELKALIGVMQNTNFHREGDAWTHTMLVIDQAAMRREKAVNPLGLMLAALCHDYGKAVCTVEVNGVIHSYCHEDKGVPLAAAFMERIGADAELKAYVMNMTELHMQPNVKARSNVRLKSTNKMFDKSVEPADLIHLSICDSMGKIPPSNDTEEFLTERYHRYMEIMTAPHVTEEELYSAGLEETDRIGEVMEYAHKLRLAGCSREDIIRQCLSYSRKVLKKLPRN